MLESRKDYTRSLRILTLRQYPLSPSLINLARSCSGLQLEVLQMVLSFYWTCSHRRLQDEVEKKEIE